MFWRKQYKIATKNFRFRNSWSNFCPIVFINNKKIQIHFRRQKWNEIAFGRNIRMKNMFNYCISTNFLFQIQQNLLKLNNCRLLFLRILNLLLWLTFWTCLFTKKVGQKCAKFLDFMHLPCDSLKKWPLILTTEWTYWISSGKTFLIYPQCVVHPGLGTQSLLRFLSIQKDVFQYDVFKESIHFLHKLHLNLFINLIKRTDGCQQIGTVSGTIRWISDRNWSQNNQGYYIIHIA